MVTVPVKRKVLVRLGSAVIGHLKKGQKTRIEKSHIRIKTRIRKRNLRPKGEQLLNIFELEHNDNFELDHNPWEGLLEG